MLDQRLARIRAAVDALHHAFGNAGFVETAGQEFADCGHFLARLEDHGIARDQRGDDMAVRQMRGEVIGPEHDHQAMRLVAQRGGALQRAVELLLPGAFGVGSNRDIDLADNGLDFRPGFPQWLAGFPRDQFGEGFGMLAHGIGEAAEQFDALA